MVNYDERRYGLACPLYASCGPKDEHPHFDDPEEGRAYCLGKTCPCIGAPTGIDYDALPPPPSQTEGERE